MIRTARHKEVQYVLFDGTQESAIDVSKLVENRVCEYILHYNVAGIPPSLGKPTITLRFKYGNKKFVVRPGMYVVKSPTGYGYEVKTYYKSYFDDMYEKVDKEE